jgi:hypothetical protein
MKQGWVRVLSHKFIAKLSLAGAPQGGVLSGPQYRYSGLLRGHGGLFQNEETKRGRERDPHGPDIHSRSGTEERASRRVNPLGLPGETMRRMVPSKWLLINLIAAWKNTPQGAPAALTYSPLL